MAHFVIDLVPRLSLFSPRRWSGEAWSLDFQYPGRILRQRALAWSQLDVRRLGRYSWNLANLRTYSDQTRSAVFGSAAFNAPIPAYSPAPMVFGIRHRYVFVGFLQSIFARTGGYHPLRVSELAHSNSASNAEYGITCFRTMPLFLVHWGPCFC